MAAFCVGFVEFCCCLMSYLCLICNVLILKLICLHVLASQKVENTNCKYVVHRVYFWTLFWCFLHYYSTHRQCHRRSLLLADFPRVGVGIILTVRFLINRSFDFSGGLFEGALPKSQKVISSKQTYKK